MRTTLQLCAVLVVVLIPTFGSGACFNYDIPAVKIEGRIVRGERQTAAGSQTHDDRDYHWYVVVDSPICVSGPGSDKVEGARRSEVWPGPGISIGKFDGQLVRMTGSFLPTHLPHYHAYLIFSVASIEALAGRPAQHAADPTAERRGGSAATR